MLIPGKINIVTKVYIADYLVFLLNQSMSVNYVEIGLAFDQRALRQKVVIVGVVLMKAKDGESVRF